jgi:hypothetical protein
MSTELETPMERITWRDGHTLTSRDMNDAERSLYRLRRLHNLYLHGVASGNWGIVAGFSVALLSSGDALAVHEGYALDADGRELILGENVIVPVPAHASGWWVIVIRYQETRAYCRSARRIGCEDSPLGPRWEFPAFVWLDPDELRLGRDVPLAAMQLLDGIVQPPLVQAVRRIAQPISRYKLRSGITLPFETVWTEQVTVGPGWFESKVDTTAAGFVSNPAYFANLRRSGQDFAVPFDSAIFLADVAPQGFRIRVLTGLEHLGLPGGATAAKRQGWTVSWLGFEADPEPAPISVKYVHLSGFSVTNVQFWK